MDISNFLKRSIEATIKAVPEARTCLSGEQAKHLRGVALKNLPLEWAFASNVLPMERLVMLSGKWASCKSALGFEFLRLVCEAGGGGQLVDTENKVSPSLFASLIREFADRIQLTSVGTLDKSQAVMTAMVQTYLKGDKVDEAEEKVDDEAKDLRPKAKKAAAKKVKVDNEWPLAVMMDSINPRTDATADKIAEEGSASKAYADGANLNTTYLANMMGVLMGRNIVMLAVGHAKKAMQQSGAGGAKPNVETYTVPGGDAWSFHATYHFRLSAYSGKGNKSINSKIVTIKNVKNSLGDENRRCKVVFYWVKSDEDASQQMSWFDWDAATVDMLTDKEAMPVNRLAAILNVVKHDDGTCSCKELKLKNVEPQAFTAALYADAEKLAALRKALGIHVYEEIKSA